MFSRQSLRRGNYSNLARWSVGIQFPKPGAGCPGCHGSHLGRCFSTNPGKFFAANDYLVISNLYESLYGHDEKDNLVPALATAVEMKDDGEAVSDPDRPIISGGQAETLVVSCCHVGADLAVASHSTRIGHKDTRFSGHVRAEIP